MPELKDVFTALEKIEGGKELADVVLGLKNSLNSEAKNLRDRAKAAEDALGLVKKSLNIEGDDVKTGLESFLSTVKTKEKSSMTETETLKAQIADLGSKFSAMETKAQKEAEKARIATRDSLLIQGLTKLGARSEIVPKLGKMIALDSSFDENGSVIFQGKDGSKVDPETYIKSFLDENPVFIKNDQNNGSGANNNPSQKGSSQKVISPKDFGANIEGILKGDIIVDHSQE